MSTAIENLRRISARDVKDHTAIFDSYVVLGRDIDYISLKFGMDPYDVVNLLEGYGERIRVQTQEEKQHAESTSNKFSRLFGKKSVEERMPLTLGESFDTSARGRLSNLSRALVEEYIERFYPGISSENPQNDWISIDAYLEQFHAGWRQPRSEK